MAQNPPTELTLANLAGGALMETATAELRRIAENIQDPNTAATAKRKLVITLQLEPDETRQMVKMTYSTKADIPGPDAGKTVALVGMAPGSKTLALYEAYTQQALFPQEPLPNVAPLDASKQA